MVEKLSGILMQGSFPSYRELFSRWMFEMNPRTLYASVPCASLALKFQEIIAHEHFQVYRDSQTTTFVKQ